MKPTQTRHIPKSTRRTTGTGTDATFRLLGGVQRRLWLEAIWAGALRGAWFGAALAGLGAAVHLVLREHAIAPVLLAAGTAFVASTVAAAARGRPSLAGAAARADAWFDGRDLLSSAMDLVTRRPSERVAAAQFVAESADDRARTWLPRLRPIGASLRWGRFFVPGALLGLFLFLYGLPGARPAAPAGRETTAESRAGVDPVERQPANAPGDRAIADEGPSVWARGADSGFEDRSRSLHDVQATLTDPDRLQDRTTPVGAKSGSPVAGSGAGQSSVAGRAAGIEAPASMSEPARFLAVRFVEIAAAAGQGHDVTGSGAGRELERAFGGSPRAEQVPNLTTGSASIVGRDAIRPALRAYVAEYGRKIRELE